MQKILVTGADGFLGSNLVRELLQRSYSIRAFVQKGRQQKTLAGLDIECLTGDILNEEDIFNAMEGCDAVIHTAASTSVWPSRSSIVNSVNINGTANVITAALHYKVSRLIYVGSANSFSFGSKQQPGVEDTPYKSEKYGLDYMDSKYKAQQLILKEVKESGLNAVIVNPTFMLGPYDSNPSSGAIVLAIFNQKIPGYSIGGRNYICVKDTAAAIANALTMGRIGECYILGNQNLSYKEAFTRIAQIIGVPAPRFLLPSVFVKTYGIMGSVISKIGGRSPTVSYSMARIGCDEHYFSPAKAVAELGLSQTPIEVGIKECFEWLKENGYIKQG